MKFLWSTKTDFLPSNTDRLIDRISKSDADYLAERYYNEESTTMNKEELK